MDQVTMSEVVEVSEEKKKNVKKCSGLKSFKSLKNAER